MEHLQVIHQVKPDTVAVSSVQSQIFACIDLQTGVTFSQILAEIYQIFVVSELVADTLQLRYQKSIRLCAQKIISWISVAGKSERTV